MTTLHESVDDVVNKAMSVVDWTAVTAVETAAFGTTLSMMREVELHLRLHNALFDHKGMATLLIVAWGVFAVLADVPSWLAIAVPATGTMFDMLWCYSRRALVHGIMAHYHEELLAELRSLSERYPVTIVTTQ
jgi:hypothetical protein